MKTKEELGDSLCKYCPLERKGAYNNNGGSVAGCEGSDCDNAYDNYLETTKDASKFIGMSQLEIRLRKLNAMVKVRVKRTKDGYKVMQDNEEVYFAHNMNDYARHEANSKARSIAFELKKNNIPHDLITY